MHRTLYSTPDSALSTVVVLPTGRLLLARLLRAASLGLARVARRLGRTETRPRSFSLSSAGNLPRIEYCAEAGAPEGALYVDGQFVGRLPVDRL